MVCVRYINVERQRHFQEFPVIEIKKWRSVLLVGEAGLHREKPLTFRKSLTNFIT
jgi:hypothetical protein